MKMIHLAFILGMASHAVALSDIKWKEFKGVDRDLIPWLKRQSTYAFVDQYNSEFNRCVMPMKGGYTDNYYMQMAQNIRKYKGARPIPKLKGLHAKKIDSNWMLLLIDVDRDPGTGWYGYDFLVNQETVDSKTTTLMRYSHYTPDSPWIKHSEIKISCAGNQLELAVPRRSIGLEGDAFSFDFHWSDNPADLKDPISLCSHGDSAPNRRFNCRCIWEK